MALNASVLGAQMKAVASNYDNLEPPVDEVEMESRRTNYYNELANAIISHITSAGVVNTTVTVATPSGPGSGTGIGTLS